MTTNPVTAASAALAVATSVAEAPAASAALAVATRVAEAPAASAASAVATALAALVAALAGSVAAVASAAVAAMAEAAGTGKGRPPRGRRGKVLCEGSARATIS